MRRRFLENTQFNYMRYMTIEVLEDGLLIQVPSSVEYTIGGNWETLEANDSREFYKGQFVSFKKTYTLGGNFGTFVIKGMCNLRGNCMSMVFGDSGYKNNDLSELYQPFCAMFENCNGIVSVDPTFLPATTLAANCYEAMFRGCTSLTTAPELPATTLANGCYYSMFYGCTKLNYIKMLATDISAPACLGFWVSGVASTGTFVKNPDMTSLPTGTSGIPYGWTVVNDGNLITFTVNGTEYQAEEGMTFYDWALSEYYDSSCLLNLGITGNVSLRDDIINGNISSDDSALIIYGWSTTTTPVIYTDTIIQPISYIANLNGGGWD